MEIKVKSNDKVLACAKIEELNIQL